jgi:ribosomal protein L31E
MTEARDFFQGKIFMVRSISSKNFRILEVSVDFIIEKQISERGVDETFGGHCI